MNSLIQALKKVKDFRKLQGQRHPLWRVLLIIILGLMQGYTGYRALGDFARFHQDLLLTTLNIVPERVPSYSTIRRVMLGVDCLNLLDIFNQWASQFTFDKSLRDWIAIDGKTLRSTVNNYHNNYQNFVVIVSLFSQNSGVVLNLNYFENKKSSEIHQVQGSIRTCPLQNQVFTLDALHCQKATTQAIIDSNNHYTIAVKKNQKTLYNSLEYVSTHQTPITVNCTIDKSHGREIERTTYVFEPPAYFCLDWWHVKSFIKVVRQVKRGNANYNNIAYYISSLSETAKVFADKIKGHWAIENKLHWIKDVILQEDHCSFNDTQATTNFSILNTVALNLFRILGFDSITEAQRWLRNKWSRLWVLLE
ncbi:ISAs1 family transposase [Moorena sp. SIO3A2]|uniref:ISAs1 family transposase n=1 Tax=Moorena sp. SIO3A2 TaxID=2607841 RepID=UPI0013BC7205|nr:ISAs1 family transposase [Moorena sp. SIO3A2]NER89929.1 ISAs1 family transposase [Moorena sp. SIO3A2]